MNGRGHSNESRDEAGAVSHGFGVSIYGILYATGRIGAGTPQANRDPLDAARMLGLAVRHCLSVLEVSTTFIDPAEDGAALRAFRESADRAGIRLVVAGPNVLDVGQIARQIELCEVMGVGILRCTMSTLLCGDRSPLGGYAGWKDHVKKVIAALRQNIGAAEKAGVTIAVENHQDADSETLLELCRTVDSPRIGVTLDAGNPLAVAEDPVEFATRLLPFIADVHLKDYRMITTDEGYRLVHCAIGDGVVDFPRLLRLLQERPEVPRSIEMAAWNERHIRLFTPEWWAGYGPRDVRSFIPVARLIKSRGEPENAASEWRTPLELGTMAGAAEWENARLIRSIENLAHVEGELHGTQA